MANRKGRGKPSPSKYHDETSAVFQQAYWDLMLRGDASWIIRPKPRCFPPFVPTAAYEKDLKRLVSRMAREQELYRDVAFLQRIEKELACNPQASERELSDWIKIGRTRLRRILGARRQHAQLMAYLDRTFPERAKAALRAAPQQRPAGQRRGKSKLVRNTP